MAATEPKTRRRRGASGAPENGTIEIQKQDLQRLLDALRSARDGESGVRLPAQKIGVMGDLATAFNQLAERGEALTSEVGRVSKVIRQDGPMPERPQLKGVKGPWAYSDDSVNSMIEHL